MNVLPVSASHPAYSTETSRQTAIRPRLASLLQNPWLQGSVLYALCFAVLAAIIFATPGFLGTDDYYHARISDQIIEQGRLRLDFPWLPRTILNNDDFTDHHLLFHLYVAPWVHLDGLRGAKLATVSIAAGVFVAVWLLLHGIGARYALGWSLGLFALSTPFLYRMLMVRTQGASLLMLVLALHFMFQRRYRWLIPLAFGYAWLYNGFVLLMGVSAAYTLAVWLEQRKLVWQPVAACAVGIGLGLVINPYFPQNLAFISEHLGAKTDLESSVRVGNEWYAYRTSTLWANSMGALLILVVGFMHASFSHKQRDAIETTLLLVALLTLYMVFKSRRFIEYYPAFALLFAAAAWGRSDISLHTWIPDWRKFWRGLPYESAARAAVALGVVATFGYFANRTLSVTYQDAQNARPVEVYQGASEWLKTHTPPGSAVFQTDWDDFTRLFYYNTHNTYLVGLDPTYLQRADPVLWNQWVAITQGRVTQPSQIIHDTFGANYVMSDRNHDAFEARADDDPAMQLVYQDRYSLVWRIIREGEN